MEINVLLDQIAVTVAATVRRTMQEEFRKQGKSRNSTDDWMNEKEILALCGKSHKTLIRAITAGKFNPKDIRPNPLCKGYLFRRSAMIGE